MPISPAQFIEMETRLAKGKPRQPVPADATNDELALHDEIIAYCKAQRWPYIRARADIASGIAVGSQDFTVFASGGRVFNVECKSRLGKLKPEQAGWALAMKMNGHVVFVVRSMREFREIVETHENET